MRDLRHHRETGEPGVCFVVAIIGGVAAVAGAASQAHAASSVAKTQQQTAAANNAQIQKNYDDTKALELPAINAGQAATGRISGLLNLGGDSASAAKAFQDYQDSTGYKFQLGSGVNAITSSRAASGSLDSGGTLKALDAYGQNLGASYFSNYLGQVGTVADRGTSATGALAGAGQNATSGIVASNTNAADATSNATLSAANATSSLFSSLTGIYGLAKGKSSYGNAVTGSSGSGGGGGGGGPWANWAGGG